MSTTQAVAVGNMWNRFLFNKDIKQVCVVK